VEVATSRGAVVLPYRWRDATTVIYAEQQQAILADEHRRTERYSLSPASLSDIAPGTRLVLPSLNGATLSLRAEEFSPTVAGCFRNARAVAAFACSQGKPVTVIACGERWADGSLRPCWEDLAGAGAVIAELPGTRSPEAEAACQVFRNAKGDLPRTLRVCSSGRELMERGFAADVELAGALDASSCVPVLTGGVYTALHWGSM